MVGWVRVVIKILDNPIRNVKGINTTKFRKRIGVLCVRYFRRLLKVQILLFLGEWFASSFYRSWWMNFPLNEGISAQLHTQVERIPLETDSVFFFIITPTRCTNFTNLFYHETLSVSESSSAHHQEFIHCTLSNGVCHTGL